MSTIDEALYHHLNCCPLCHSDRATTLRLEKNDFSGFPPAKQPFFRPYEATAIPLKLCLDCDFAYLDRLPRRSDFFQQLYSQIDYDYAYEFAYHGKQAIHRQIRQVLSCYITQGHWLDIGAWCGTLLGSLGDIYQGIGCEINAAAAAYGRSLGFDIRTGAFDQIGFAPQSFDLITLVDVLEHLPEPRSVLVRIHDLLRSGGILYIKVPNGQAQIVKQNFLNACHLSQAGVAENFVHINHFNHASLARVLQRLGFEILEQGYTPAELWNLAAPHQRSRRQRQLENALKTLITQSVNWLSLHSTWDIGFNIYTIARRRP